jgi:FSR family fosmidomycin resistance protein-like MFS transporter
MIPALLPVIINKLSLSLTLVGSLLAVMQLPSILSPFVGYMADRVSLRYFVILAPAITATLISSLGFTTGYFYLAIILFLAGISSACYHAPAPAMIGRTSGNQVGMGMSFFMAAGEFSRMVGPMLVVWAISVWTLDGFYRVVVFGWAASFVLYLRLRHIPARLNPPSNLRSIAPLIRSLFLPLSIILLSRAFLRECVSTFLPTYMDHQGASLLIAGGSLAILEAAGVAGALISGTISDKLGRKIVLLVATIGAAVLMLVFLNVDGYLLIPVLIAMGFFALSTGPVMLAMVQDQMPENRAVGNGIFIMLIFMASPIALMVIGILGDQVGLHQVYFWSALISLLAIPAIIALPSKTDNSKD